MKKLLFSLLFILSLSITNSQIASRIIVTQSTPQGVFPDNYCWIDNSPGQMNRWFVALWDSAKIKYINLKWLYDSTNLHYYPLSSNPANYLTTINSGQVTGALGYIPYNSSNPAGYITGVSGSDIVTALGYTPYNSTNPNSYISGINSGMVTSALGYTPYNSSNPNGYISSYTETDPLFNTKFSSKTTTDLAEGTNLYYTPGRFNSAFTSKSTSDLSEGVNLYYTAARFNSAFSSKTTTDLTEGSNQYFTQGRARSSITLSTIGTSGAATYNSSTGQLNIPNYVTPVTPTLNLSVTRPVNGTSYTISTTQNSRVYYNIRIACTASIGSNATGSVTLQYSTNGGSSWNDLQSIENSNTVTLAIALNSVTVQAATLSAEIPANALCRMVSSSTGTTTITYVRGQEVLY